MIDEAKTGVSLRPSDAVEGGLFNDVVGDCEFLFTMFNYGGGDLEIPALRVDIKERMVDDQNALGELTGETYNQHFSMGSKSDWCPSADGAYLIPVGSQKELKNSCNGILFIKSLVNSGFPEPKITNNIKDLNGLVAHFSRVAAPKREGLEKAARADGKKFADTILIVDRIYRFPWEEAPKVGKAGGRGKAGAGAGVSKKPAGAATTTDDAGVDPAALVEIAVNTVIALAEKAGEAGMPKKDIPKKAFVILMKEPNRQAITALVSKDEFLGAEGRPWMYVDSVLYPAPAAE
jgi:hypothetical protein